MHIGTLTTIDISAALGFVQEAGGLIVDEKGNRLTKLSQEKQMVAAVNNPKMLAELKLGKILG